MNVGIIGCGLIGRKRAAAVRAPHRLAAVSDLDQGRAASLAAQHAGCVVAPAPLDVLRRPDVDLVVVATTNDALGPLTAAAIEPASMCSSRSRRPRSAEIATLAVAARERGLVVKVGFNHRFHPALLKAREIWSTRAHSDR